MSRRSTRQRSSTEFFHYDDVLPRIRKKKKPSPKKSEPNPRKIFKRKNDSKQLSTKPTTILKHETDSKTKKKKKKPWMMIASCDVMKIAPENQWMDLNVPPEELRPSATLTTGQCFSWIVVSSHMNNDNDNDDNDLSREEESISAWGRHDEREWVGPLSSSDNEDYVISIKETPTTTLYRVLVGDNDGPSVKALLMDYFQLKVPLQPLYQLWSKCDKRCRKIAHVIPGVRILRQQPIECLFSFLCSSNNNIPRITQLLTNIRQTYGTQLLHIPISHNNNQQNATTTNKITIYSFPTLARLKLATEEQLRHLGLGYRANYIIQTRDYLIERGGDNYLYQLRNNQDPKAVQQQLIQLSGVGRKVADCVALFSLDQIDAIPVDVHVQTMAHRDYHFTTTQKSLTPTVYQQVGDLFRQTFRSHAGWAHSLLFVAELPSFRKVLPPDILHSMDQWKHQQQQQTKSQTMKSAKTQTTKKVK